MIFIPFAVVTVALAVLFPQLLEGMLVLHRKFDVLVGVPLAIDVLLIGFVGTIYVGLGRILSFEVKNRLTAIEKELKDQEFVVSDEILEKLHVWASFSDEQRSNIRAAVDMLPDVADKLEEFADERDMEELTETAAAVGVLVRALKDIK